MECETVKTSKFIDTFTLLRTQDHLYKLGFWSNALATVAKCDLNCLQQTASIAMSMHMDFGALPDYQFFSLTTYELLAFGVHSTYNKSITLTHIMQLSLFAFIHFFLSTVVPHLFNLYHAQREVKKKTHNFYHITGTWCQSICACSCCSPRLDKTFRWEAQFLRICQTSAWGVFTLNSQGLRRKMKGKEKKKKGALNLYLQNHFYVLSQSRSSRYDLTPVGVRGQAKLCQLMPMIIHRRSKLKLRSDVKTKSNNESPHPVPPNSHLLLMVPSFACFFL